jgi:hypothetical protein
MSGEREGLGWERGADVCCSPEREERFAWVIFSAHIIYCANMPMKKVYTMRSSSMQGRGKCCKMTGHGFFSNVGNFLKKTGRSLLGQAKVILPAVAKELAPTLLATASAKLGEQASKAGVPDAVVNLGNQLAQSGAQKLQKSATANTKGLTESQRNVSNFITDKSADLLGSLLSRAENRGSGVMNLGRGVRGFSGKGLTVEARNLFSPVSPQ